MSGGANERDGEVVTRDPDASQDDSAVESMLRKVAHLSDVSLHAPLPRVGQIIGDKYRIEEQLGRGGMGAVYRATHLVSQKQVALKWMLRPIADGTAYRRLLREAQAAGRIDHPNVVDVYDVGQESECAYLVMELLRGESLRARLARGPMALAEVMRVLVPAMRGVSAAHAVGVIHRDLKPDNIFLCQGPDGSAREAKVLDFGVSAVAVPISVDPTLTDHATILGTPAYMSPEQLASAQDTDERTDVYAFGVILYEALTGELPFVADSYSGLVLSVALNEPQPPTALRPELPPELDRLVLQALSKRRDDRPPTVEALMQALAPWYRTPSSRGSAPPKLHRARWSLSWLPVAFACALALALLIRVADALWFDGRGAPERVVVPSGAPLPLAVPTVSETYQGAPAEPAATPSLEAEGTKPSAVAVDAALVARSCEQARTAGQTVDGLLSIDPDGTGPIRAFKVFCSGMAGVDAQAAREYLELAQADANVTRFRYGGGSCPCPDLARRFTRVRLDPRTLAIDPTDGTFAAYDRPLVCEQQHQRQCGESTNLAWGGAGSCRGSGDTSGSASIDLRGTPFALAPGARFVPAGFGAAGSAVISRDRKTAALVGGGMCGSLVPQQGSVSLVAAR